MFFPFLSYFRLSQIPKTEPFGGELLVGAF